MKICIDKVVVEFGSLLKNFNGKYLESSGSINTKSAIFDKPSIFLPKDLST